MVKLFCCIICGGVATHQSDEGEFFCVKHWYERDGNVKKMEVLEEKEEEHEHDWVERHREEGSEVITIYYECRICYMNIAKDYVYLGNEI